MTVKTKTGRNADMLEVEVKEATSKGYAVARGGETQSTFQCLEAEQEEDESG